MNVDQFEGLERQLKEHRSKVDVTNLDFSVREIVRMYIDDELIISPSYQRKYRWPTTVASKFIESLFLGLPIPPIFVATNDNFTWEVVDGLQRISTLILYLADDPEVRKAVSSPDPLRLTGLENLTQLNEKTYQELPQPLKLFLARQPLQVVQLTDKSHKSVRFDLFERLNTGSISLSAQEVRTAVYGGKFLSFIEDLSKNEHLNSLLKLQEVNKNDGTKTEQVLKYFAYKNSSNTFKGAVNKFLNSYVESLDNEESRFDYNREKVIFEQVMEFLSNALNGQAFLRARTSVTPLVQFEAVAVGIGQLIESNTIPVIPSIDWINDPDLVSASTRGSNTRSMLSRRLQRAKDLFSGKCNVLPES